MLIRVIRRSLLLIVVLLVVTCILISYFIFRRDEIDTASNRTEPMLHIKTKTDWDSVTQSNRCIVFIDGAWNIDIVRFRRPFARFADWCHGNGNARVLTLSIDPDDTTNDVWKICQQLWHENKIPSGGLKNYGGAGRVVWINNGKVIDYAWCMELTNHDGIDILLTRTSKAFE